MTLNWNKKETIKNLKDSLLPALNDLDWHWLVRDNASTDGAAQMISEWGRENDRIHPFLLDNNKSNYSQGMNFLFDESGAKPGDLIITLNNDVTIRDPSSLKKMVALISNDKTIGQVGAKLNYPTGGIQHVGVLFHKNSLPYHFRAGEEESSSDRSNRYFPAVTGALSLTTADIYSQIRHPDQMNWQFDDIWFSCAVRELGKKIVLCGETNVTHAESISLKQNPVHKLFQKQNIDFFLKRWKKSIDISETTKYSKNAEYNLYKAPFKK